MASASDSKCAVCGKSAEKLLKCSKCKSESYCGKDCQLAGWGEHKKICGKRGLASLLQNLEKESEAYTREDWESVLAFAKECEQDLAVHFDPDCELKMLRPLGMAYRRMNRCGDAARTHAKAAGLAIARGNFLLQGKFLLEVGLDHQQMGDSAGAGTWFENSRAVGANALKAAELLEDNDAEKISTTAQATELLLQLDTLMLERVERMASGETLPPATSNP
ncbi:hypothetical protein T484DRAFT_1976874 [Baffinella frigidus]|nr:hypothetical protein T484DRAFT_1976874 [Cryptophyta sp. CCMP2293]|mmetsp:Transcript_10889/g.26400  ORF Transcript_10889/g.26400 Transcript_10889/m.26400 type:complete len:221 (+) Transcript_10889:48-710(+)|eukprot:CAMPEP_0180319170 /NCGR_PEP_ID=MMETSP0988-20121125/34847_1 /TAXON_ID=697907 /ORGANISM="non described non described, Strain CCMP2293" /LENGTH=220 /DNA_ID=CAMNT_0022304713 /DNA_START=30 /DNA_END=692 /DNA_ORIENTATION=-